MAKESAFFRMSILKVFILRFPSNTEIFAFIAVLVFRLLSFKVLLINRKEDRNC